MTAIPSKTIRPQALARQDNAQRKERLGLVTRVLHIRVKDKHAVFLQSLAREVNLVWNYVNDLSYKITRREGRFASAFDIAHYTCGATKEGLNLHSQTIQAITEECVTRRKQFKKSRLNWRVSNPKSSRYSLGWVPFKSSAIAYRNGQVWFGGQAISLWDSFGLAGYAKDEVLGPGNFSQDARGRWYLNLTVEAASWPREDRPERLNQVHGNAIGIDLGLKDFMATSVGGKVEARRFYRDLETASAMAQRAGKRQRVKAIHAKIANRRKDFLHKESTALVNTHQAIFVGNVNASALARTSMGKSVLDAGWSSFRAMLQYKCDSAGVWFKAVNEAFSTQDCSCCGSRAGPKGREDLDVRAWTCPVCGTHHDRDVNAATNIKIRGLALLAQEFEKEFSTAAQARACETAANKEAARAATGVGHDPLAVGISVLPTQVAAVG